MKQKVKFVIAGGALLLCVLFFVLPLAQCTQSSDVTATGFEIATATGDLMAEQDAEPLVFALIVIPFVLLVLAFVVKFFAVLLGVSLLGAIAQIIFMIGSHIKFNDEYEGMVKLTVYNWLVLVIWVGLIVLSAYGAKPAKKKE